MKNYTPTILIKYLSKEFFLSFLIVLIVFFSLAILVNFVEELSFFKDKKINNLITLVTILTLSKSINTLIELSVFIFLFSGILFFSKIKKNNEINIILFAGLSRSTPILVPAIISFMLGLFIISFVSPISASFIKFYEKTKRIYLTNDNLIVINSSGLWFLEKGVEDFNIIKADKIFDNNFSILKNITIFNLDNNFNFIKRIDSPQLEIKNKIWSIKNIQNLNNKDNNLNNSSRFVSSIEIDDLKNYFSNANSVSFWEINDTIKIINERGYSADELKIKLHKYISLPVYLFAIILLSTIFTLSIDKNFNTYLYLFFGLLAGFLIFFLNDLSIAVGLSNKLPLKISVWSPVMIILFLSITNLIKMNEK